MSTCGVILGDVTDGRVLDYTPPGKQRAPLFSTYATSLEAFVAVSDASQIRQAVRLIVTTSHAAACRVGSGAFIVRVAFLR